LSGRVRVSCAVASWGVERMVRVWPSGEREVVVGREAAHAFWRRGMIGEAAAVDGMVDEFVLWRPTSSAFY
jgi:hypothetical protein